MSVREERDPKGERNDDVVLGGPWGGRANEKGGEKTWSLVKKRREGWED